jgi:hypothetical protein
MAQKDEYLPPVLGYLPYTAELADYELKLNWKSMMSLLTQRSLIVMMNHRGESLAIKIVLDFTS